jgi:hypothetical protein
VHLPSFDEGHLCKVFHYQPLHLLANSGRTTGNALCAMVLHCAVAVPSTCISSLCATSRRVSPPDVIKATTQKLQQIGPGGRQKLLMYQLVALPIWAASAVSLAGKYATRYAQAACGRALHQC